ncbi:MAG: hypothetical protein ACYDH2_06575 [Anaerolineaceae bacterium]
MKDQEIKPLHHRRSIRLPDFDYSSSGSYFIITSGAVHEPPLQRLFRVFRFFVARSTRPTCPQFFRGEP